MTHLVFLTAIAFSLPILNKKKIPFFVFSFLILFLFLALRYDYGNDYMSYYSIHNAINEGRSAWGDNDILFRYFSTMFSDFYVFILVISMIYSFTMYSLVRKNLKIRQYWLAIFILLINPYLFLVHLSGLRQTLAICFFVFAVHFAIERNLFKYVIFIFIASGFHQSAILLLPAYFFLTDKKINKRRFVTICALLALLLFTPLFEIALNRVLVYFPQYNYYVSLGKENSLRATVISSFFFFLMIFNINKLEGKEIVFGKLGLLATLISILTMRLSMLTRVGMYFDIFLIVAIPLIFSRMKVKKMKYILFLTMIFIFILRYYAFFTNPIWQSFREYRTIIGAPKF